MNHIPKYIHPPASNGGEDPRRNVSGGVDGVAAIAAQRNPDKQDQETHSDGFAACRGRFVLLVGQSHDAEQEHGGPKNLEAQTSPANKAKSAKLVSGSELTGFRGYLVNKSTEQGQVRRGVGGENSSCGLHARHCHVPSAIIVNSLCEWTQQC